MSFTRTFFAALFALTLVSGSVAVVSAQAQSLTDTQAGSQLVIHEQDNITWDGKGLRPSI